LTDGVIMPVYRARNGLGYCEAVRNKVYTVGIGTNGMAMFPYAIAQMGSFIPNDEGWNRWAVDEKHR
jgi:hypothetical protein